MRFLVSEKLGPHKFKTPEGYLICTDAILSRTGKQEYKRSELFGDACENPDELVQVDRTNDEVFSDKAMTSFENKPICVEHPDVDVNAENHNELSVGFVRDIHKGEYNGEPVMMGTLVITDKAAIDAVESGEYEELSCGYDCDVEDSKNPQQKNIRGNHVALCKQGRAGIARIVDSVDDAGIKVWQVRQGYAIVVKRYWQQYGKNAFVDATESSIEAARYHRGSLERNDKMDFVIIDCNDGKYKIEDSEMKDIQSTKAPGTDKIIYVMQSDIDKNLYFYIGKTFSMKEGAWGYTKFEMGNTTPEQLKAELSKNGWHAVSQGVARIIDAEHEVVTDEIMKDESRQTLIEKLRTVSVPYGERYALTSGSGWHIDIQHHGQASYENINKYPHASPKESSKATIRLWYNGKHMKTFEGPLNSAKSDAIRYLQTRTEDSWLSVEEENYNKANKPVGAKDSKEQLFTVKYKQGDTMYIHKVCASSIEDAISKVKSQDTGALPSSVWQHGSVYVNASSQITSQKIVSDIRDFMRSAGFAVCKIENGKVDELTISLKVSVVQSEKKGNAASFTFDLTYIPTSSYKYKYKSSSVSETQITTQLRKFVNSKLYEDKSLE